jgi:hypothetical protein
MGPLYFALDKNVARKRVAFPVFLISFDFDHLAQAANPLLGDAACYHPRSAK